MRVVLAVLLLTLAAHPAAARMLGQKAVEDHIRPAYARLASALGGLQQSTAAYCDGAGQDRSALDKAFREAVLAWAGVEHMRFGPITQENRYERFAFWPDPKGLGQKQLAAVLRERSADVTRPETLREKSVALQGLTAFELLFWADAGPASGPDRAFACSFGKAIAANLAEISAAVRDEWSRPDGFAAGLIEPGPEKLYRDERDVLLELFKAFRTGLQQARSLKLNRVLMGNMEEAQPRRAAFWRSGNAIDVIMANLEAIRELYQEGGLYEIVRQAGKGADRAMLDQFTLMQEALEPFAGKPIAEVLATKDGWGKANAVVFGLIKLQSTGGNAIVEAAQLPMTFNSLDGD
jgi:hypothetical protein